MEKVLYLVSLKKNVRFFIGPKEIMLFKWPMSMVYLLEPMKGSLIFL
jgi:hypothetical protein